MIGDLLPQHQLLIDASAISPEVALARGYRSVREKAHLGRLGFSQNQQRVPALLIPIHDVDGKVALHQARPDDPRAAKGGKPIKYETPSRSCLVIDVPPPCRPALRDPKVDLWITEGSRKADAAASAGLCCIALLGVYGWRGTNKEGGKTALPDWESIALNGRHVYVAFDSDVTTKPEVQKALERFASYLQSKGAVVYILRLPSGPDGAKVGLDDYLATGNSIESLMALAVKADRPVWDAGPEAPREPPAIAFEADILGRFAKEVEKAGVAGEVQVIKLIFLVVITRLLSRIVSLTVRGPSAGGKSYLVGRVLDYFPDSAYHALTAMSEKALIYDDTPLEHRMLVIYEAEGVAGPFQSYLIRSLLSEGRVRYTTVVKTKDGMGPLTIERDGPTGLILTTTATRLHPENETRLLTVVVSDTPEQTQSILLAQARAGDHRGDVTPWHGLQGWLEDGPLEVAIPYAVTLAQEVSPVAVRLRRDFPTVLALIKAHALLHRATREVVDGVVQATFEDYEAVRQLVADLISDAADQAVPGTVRQTVSVVADLTAGGSEATVKQVASKLEIDKSSASRRVRKALDDGYLTNQEERQGKPHRLVVGDPMPADTTLLPTVDDLRRLHGCTATDRDSPEEPTGQAAVEVAWDTPAETPATVQPSGEQRPLFGTPPTHPCPSCHLMHAAGTTCGSNGHAPEPSEIDLVAEAYRIFGDMIEGGVA